MLASDLIGSKVFDSDGKRIGHCFEVEVDGEDSRLHLSALLVGSFAAFQRLGYGYRDVRGPVGLRSLVRRQPSYRIAWDQVASVKHRVLKLSSPVDELERL